MWIWTKPNWIRHIYAREVRRKQAFAANKICGVHAAYTFSATYSLRTVRGSPSILSKVYYARTVCVHKVYGLRTAPFCTHHVHGMYATGVRGKAFFFAVGVMLIFYNTGYFSNFNRPSTVELSGSFQ